MGVMPGFFDVLSDAPTAHILGDAGNSPWAFVAGGVVLLLGALLVVEHLYVKHGRAPWRELRKPAAAVAAMATLAIVAPPVGLAQSPGEPVGLPDLISDPPFTWFTRDIWLNDTHTRVMAFDGYLHNIGEGRLDLFGNPQIEGGVKQRVYDGERWEEVGSPTVRFETDDGHNHFHLIAASAYSLWDHGQRTEVTPSAKVGFCLLDTEQREEVSAPYYDINAIDYCNVDKPDATTLSMGISPGWRDTYDANTTLQWIDISDVQPGWYWLAATTDPNNEIVESNEDNNGTVFASRSDVVPGHVAQPLEIQQADEPIQLRALTYGRAGERVFIVDEGPKNGALDVPVGASIRTDTISYTPEPGFVGQDSFTYYAREASSPFPLTPTIVTVTIEVGEGQQTSAPATTAADSEPLTVTVVDQESAQHSEVAIEPRLDGRDAQREDVRWYGAGLPPGVVVDQATGELTGVLTTPGVFAAKVIAKHGATEVWAPLTWTVSPEERPSMRALNDLTSPANVRQSFQFGSGTKDASYAADGLPPGVVMITNAPILSGTPETMGTFDIEIRESVDGAVAKSFTFTWVVRPSVVPSFAL